MSFLDRADPEIIPMLAMMPPLDLSTQEAIEATRAGLAAMQEPLLAALPPVPGVTLREESAPGLDGNPAVPVRVSERDDRTRPGPALVWIHGGGMVFGAAKETDPACKQWAADLGCLVVSVDYRLAPESPYPAQVEDCYAALRWVHDHAEALGVDRNRIVVGGASAGGGLAAAASLMARDRGEVSVAFQFLEYPMLDDRDSTPSVREDTHEAVWNNRLNVCAWRAYLGDRVGGEDVPLYAAPGRATAEQLAGLPPAYIDVGELDCFRDEDIEYAQRLLQAGVAVELHVVPQAFHASEAYNPAAPSSVRITELRTAALRRALS